MIWSPLFVPGGLFLIFAAIQFATRSTIDLISTRNSLVELAAILIFFFMTFQVSAIATEQTWRLMGAGVIAYTFAMALFAVVQYFSSAGKLYWTVTPHSGGWIFGSYVNHDHYAGLMEMSIPLSAGFALAEYRRHRLSALMGFAVLVPVASVLLSGSRGGMISLLLEAGMFLFVSLFKGPRRDIRRAATRVAAVLVVAFAGFLWMDNRDVGQHLETVFEPSHVSDTAFVYRRQTALDTLRLFRDHWLLGSGLGSFQYAFPKYQSIPGDAVWDHAHDDYVETLAETGVVGGLLVLTALIMWFRLAFSHLRERLKNRGGWIQLGAALGCCGLLLHSLFDFNLHIPANALWFGVCAALATVNIAFNEQVRR